VAAFPTNIFATPSMLQKRVQPLLEPEERAEAVFQARSGPNPHILLVLLPAIILPLKFLTSGLVFLIVLIPLAPLPVFAFMYFTTFAVFAYTDRRLAVFKASVREPAVPKELLESLPRDTRLKLSHWPVWQSFRLGDRRWWVGRRFWRQLRVARGVGVGVTVLGALPI
jgi:hypothetical protein